MSDPSPPGWADDPALPPPTIYDPADDHETPPGAEPAGPVVLLLVTDADPDWTARTAFELSTAWSRGGRRIVLADLHLENPVLHQWIGDDNLEGLVDVFVYGISVTRSARPVPGRGFHIIPAGTYTSDVEGIYRHPRWSKLVEGFRDAGASLVLFAPADGADLPALARWASDLVVLGDLPDPRLLAPLREAGVPFRAHILQPRDLPGARSEGAILPAPPAFERSLELDLLDDDELHLPPPPMRNPPRRRPIYVALWLLLAIVVLALAGYVVGRLRPDLLPWPGLLGLRAGQDSSISVVAPAAVPVPSRAVGTPLPFSVQVIAFQSRTAALTRLDTDRDRVTAAPVFLSPEEIGGIVYYKILAGALPDTGAARRLKESLVAQGVVNQQDATGALALIQSVPLAFRLSEYASQQAAMAAVDSLQARNIPAYGLPVPYSDSTYRWQLYAGAYRDSASAAPMRALLTSAGLAPALVPRSGMASSRD